MDEVVRLSPGLEGPARALPWREGSFWPAGQDAEYSDVPAGVPAGTGVVHTGVPGQGTPYLRYYIPQVRSTVGTRTGGTRSETEDREVRGTRTEVRGHPASTRVPSN